MQSVSRRCAIFVVALAAVAGLSACTPGTASGPPSCDAPNPPVDALTVAMFNAMNGDRAANQLGPLVWNPQLYCLAEDWSAHMAGVNALVHRDLGSVINAPGYSGYYKTLAENIVKAPSSYSGAQIEAAWMSSSVHRANILSPAFGSVGIGWARSADRQWIYATQNFGG
jgi:uncharacterized protein YkwD